MSDRARARPGRRPGPAEAASCRCARRIRRADRRWILRATWWIWNLESACGSGVTRAVMLRQVEFVQQPVDLQEPFAINAQEIALHGEEAPVLQLLDRFGKSHKRVSAE